VGRGVIVADGAQGQPGAGAPQEPPHPRDEEEGRVHEGVVPEQQPADAGQVGEAGKVEMGSRIALHPDIAGADEAGESEPQDGQRQPRGDLVGRQNHGEQAEEGGEQQARAGPAEGTEPGRSGPGGDGEAGGRAQHHHALDAEIEHAGALHDEFADAGQDQRRRRRQHRDEDHLDDVEAHGIPLAPAPPGTIRTW